MNKLKTFIRTFVKSLASPKYYRDVLKAKWSFSLKYLIVLLFIVNILTAIKVGTLVNKYYPQAAPFINEVKQIIVDFYPKELVLTIKKQKITTNVKEPFYIEFPEQLSKIIAGYYKHLIVIDTKGKVDDYKKYESLLLVTADKLVTPDDRGQGNYQVVPLSDKLTEVPDGTKINKNLYDEAVGKILPYFDRIARYIYALILIGIVLIPFIGTAFGLFEKLIYLLPAAFLLWLLAKILKKKLSYGKVYCLGIHGLTLPIIVTLALSIFNFHIPLLYSLIFFVWMIVVLVQIKE
jgi:hypothetical protein